MIFIEEENSLADIYNGDCNECECDECSDNGNLGNFYRLKLIIFIIKLF